MEAGAQVRRGGGGIGLGGMGVRSIIRPVGGGHRLIGGQTGTQGPILGAGPDSTGAVPVTAPESGVGKDGSLLGTAGLPP